MQSLARNRNFLSHRSDADFLGLSRTVASGTTSSSVILKTYREAILGHRLESVEPSIDSIIRWLITAGGEGDLPCQKAACPCYGDFSSRPLLWHLIGLSSFDPIGKQTHQLRGWWYVLKLPKPVSLTYNLPVGWANRMILRFSDCS